MLGLGATQVKLHLHRLVDLEYVLVHRAPRGQGVSYELVYAASDRTPDALVFSGLRSVETLTYDGQRSDVTPERSGANDERSGGGRPSVGGRPGVVGVREIVPIPRVANELVAASRGERRENTTNGARHRARRTVPADLDGDR